MMNVKSLLFAGLVLLSVAAFCQEGTYQKTCGIYETSGDFLQRNLTNRSFEKFSYYPLGDLLLLSKVRIKLNASNPHWGGQVMDKFCRFIPHWIAHILLVGPICIYTNYDSHEFRFQYTDNKVTDFEYTDRGLLWASKGLDGPAKKIMTRADMEEFLTDEPELLKKFKEDNTVYSKDNRVSPWVNFLNCVLEYNSIHSNK